MNGLTRLRPLRLRYTYMSNSIQVFDQMFVCTMSVLKCRVSTMLDTRIPVWTPTHGTRELQLCVVCTSTFMCVTSFCHEPVRHSFLNLNQPTSDFNFPHKQLHTLARTQLTTHRQLATEMKPNFLPFPTKSMVPSIHRAQKVKTNTHSHNNNIWKSP